MSDDVAVGAYGFEGWDDNTSDPEYVRRFAKPPYTWQRVRRDRFTATERRRRGDSTQTGDTHTHK